MANDKPAEIIRKKMIELLEKNVVPWRKSWIGNNMTPLSMSSNKPYRGVNRFLLSPIFKPYASPYWGTYKAISGHGGQVRKGEKSSPIVFWNFFEVIDEKTGVKKKIPTLKYFSVFNAEQCEGLPEKFGIPKELVKITDFQRIESCENIIRGYKDAPMIFPGCARAAYNIGMDTIEMIPKESFDSENEYYKTLFHEMIHSTGAEKRLDRELSGNMGSDIYSKEELIAEMGSTFLMAEAGIEDTSTMENSAAYIASWLRVLKEPKNINLVVTAASAAERASEYILGKLEEVTEPEESEATAAV